LEILKSKDANGYAIGGLAGGEAKSDFFKIVRLCC
jgi:queuine/archaeosine tRNA-ribosyltransferase